MGNALPVVQVPVGLGSLGSEVCQVACEKEVVLGRDGEGVAHEGGGVDDEGAGHRAGDTVAQRLSQWMSSGYQVAGVGLGWAISKAVKPRLGTYISGSFCVSITAAMGIPKLETGPQKSAPWHC